MEVLLFLVVAAIIYSTFQSVKRGKVTPEQQAANPTLVESFATATGELADRTRKLRKEQQFTMEYCGWFRQFELIVSLNLESAEAEVERDARLFETYPQLRTTEGRNLFEGYLADALRRVEDAAPPQRQGNRLTSSHGDHSLTDPLWLATARPSAPVPTADPDVNKMQIRIFTEKDDRHRDFVAQIRSRLRKAPELRGHFNSSMQNMGYADLVRIHFPAETTPSQPGFDAAAIKSNTSSVQLGHQPVMRATNTAAPQIAQSKAPPTIPKGTSTSGVLDRVIALAQATEAHNAGNAVQYPREPQHGGRSNLFDADGNRTVSKAASPAEIKAVLAILGERRKATNIRKQAGATTLELLGLAGIGESIPPELLKPNPHHKDELATAKQARTTELRAFAETRAIPHLVHFTRCANLPTILRHGLRSVADCGAVGIPALRNDEQRLDKALDGISVSVAFPNYRMFYKYRQLSPDTEWAVLVLSPDILWTKNCGFFRLNAADHRMRDRPRAEMTTPQAFREMFETTDTARPAWLRPYDPTDSQAEVMVYEQIEPWLIKSVAFETKACRDTWSHATGGFKTIQAGPQKGMFGIREHARI